jgi:primosomal protein N' (replication factor Y) (superfamily II helicase)
VRCGCAQDYTSFVEKELEFRAALRYPPVTAMINVVVRGTTLVEALDAAGVLARDVARGIRGRTIALLGPAPAPLMKLRGEHRAQFFLKGGDRAVMNQAVRGALAAHPALARRTSIDVDPVSML